MKRVTASRLRENIYRLLDLVADTGEPIEIVRKGRPLRIVRVGVKPKPRLVEKLNQRPGALIGDPEDIVHIDWSNQWRP